MTALLIIALAFAIVALLVAVCFVVGGLWDAQADARELRSQCAEYAENFDRVLALATTVCKERDALRRQLATVSDSRCRTSAECARNLSELQASRLPADPAHQCADDRCGAGFPTDLELAAHLVAKHPQPGDKAA